MERRQVLKVPKKYYPKLYEKHKKAPEKAVEEQQEKRNTKSRNLLMSQPEHIIVSQAIRCRLKRAKSSYSMQNFLR
jgi:hypothetical protein